MIFFGKLCPKFQMCDDKKANGSLKREKSKLQRKKCKKNSYNIRYESFLY